MSDDHDLIERLRAVPFFRDLPADTLAAIADELELETHPVGTMVFREGDAADAMYLVEGGQVDVVDHQHAPIASLGPGSFVGEIALLLGEPRSAGLRASLDSRLWRLSKDDLDLLLAEHPRLGLELSRELSRRLVTTTKRLSAPIMTRCAAVWGDGAATFAAALRDADDSRVGIVEVDGAPPLGAIPDGVTRIDDTADTATIAAWNTQQVEGLDILVIPLPRRPSDVARAVIDVSEHVIVFGAVPDWVSGHRGHRLVLHADRGQDALARAVRWVNGRAIGLALSSGGSKAVAHWGVIRVLKELGISIDAVAGTSGGAVIGAAVGFQVPFDEVPLRLEEIRQATTYRRFDFNLVPRAALLKGARIRALFDTWFPGVQFSDAPVPFWVVASDVNTGDEVIIDRGPVADGLRASMSIPGALNPWLSGGRHLIDGAVVNPMPASVLRSAGIRYVIGSNVAGQDLELVGRKGRIPHLLQIMNRMINSMEREMIKAQIPLTDVVIRPVVRGGGSFDFSHIDEFVAEGERATREKTAELEQLVARADRLNASRERLGTIRRTGSRRFVGSRHFDRQRSHIHGGQMSRYAHKVVGATAVVVLVSATSITFAPSVGAQPSTAAELRAEVSAANGGGDDVITLVAGTTYAFSGPRSATARPRMRTRTAISTTPTAPPSRSRPRPASPRPPLRWSARASASSTTSPAARSPCATCGSRAAIRRAVATVTAVVCCRRTVMSCSTTSSSSPTPPPTPTPTTP